MNRDAIVRAKTRLIRIPVEPARGDAIQSFNALEVPLVEIEDGSGRVGVGFGYTIGKGGSAICELLRAELLDRLLGHDARALRTLVDSTRKSIHALTPGPIASTALAAIDVALWDLAGKRAHLCLHLLLGGAKDKVPAYNTHVGWLNRPVDELVELSAEAVKKGGFRALKIKVGKPDPEEDVERLSKVRQAVGPQITLMADANQSWNLDEAVARCLSLEEFNLAWIEEPLPATDIQGYVMLRRHTRIPLAGGESLYSTAAFYEFLRQGGLDIFQPDIARVGGLTAAWEVCALAHCANRKVAPHVSPELSVVLAAAVPNSCYVEYIPQMTPILKKALHIEDGAIFPSSLPGHGIVFDPEALDRYEVTYEPALREGASRQKRMA